MVLGTIRGASALTAVSVSVLQLVMVQSSPKTKSLLSGERTSFRRGHFEPRMSASTGSSVLDTAGAAFFNRRLVVVAESLCVADECVKLFIRIGLMSLLWYMFFAA